jgi:hypothetical protein
MKIQNLFQVGLLVLTLNACQTVPTMPYDFTPDYVAPSVHKINAQLQSIVVMPASPDERTGPITPDESELQPIIQEWKRALTVAMDKSKNFSFNSNKQVKLVVQILKFEVSTSLKLLLGGSEMSSIQARYKIVNSATGAVIYSQDVSSIGYGSNYRGWNNVSIVSYNIATRTNIESFIGNLNGYK